MIIVALRFSRVPAGPELGDVRQGGTVLVMREFGSVPDWAGLALSAEADEVSVAIGQTYNGKLLA